MSFAVPKLVPVQNSMIQDGNGDSTTYVVLPCGICACLFDFIPGLSPGGDAKYTRAMGQATGELVNKLSALYDDATMALDARIHGPAPYYDLWRAHASIGTKEKFYAYCRNTDVFKPISAEFSILLDALARMETEIQEWQSASAGETPFPLSFVHGDLVTDNFMCDPNTQTVTGVIDFEFVGVDWRVMELATSLSKFPEEEDPMTNLTLFVQGFRSSARVPLSEAEVQALPSMIRLRIVSNVVYFVGRAVSGEADISFLLERVPGYCRRIRWLADGCNREKLLALFR